MTYIAHAQLPVNVNETKSLIYFKENSLKHSKEAEKVEQVEIRNAGPAMRIKVLQVSFPAWQLVQLISIFLIPGVPGQAGLVAGPARR